MKSFTFSRVAKISYTLAILSAVLSIALIKWGHFSIGSILFGCTVVFVLNVARSRGHLTEWKK